LVQVGRDLVLELVEIVLGSDVEEVALAEASILAVCLLRVRNLGILGQVIELEIVRDDQKNASSRDSKSVRKTARDNRSRSLSIRRRNSSSTNT